MLGHTSLVTTNSSTKKEIAPQTSSAVAGRIGFFDSPSAAARTRLTNCTCPPLRDDEGEADEHQRPHRPGRLGLPRDALHRLADQEADADAGADRAEAVPDDRDAAAHRVLGGKDAVDQVDAHVVLRSFAACSRSRQRSPRCQGLYRAPCQRCWERWAASGPAASAFAISARAPGRRRCRWRTGW